MNVRAPHISIWSIRVYIYCQLWLEGVMPVDHYSTGRKEQSGGISVHLSVSLSVRPQTPDAVKSLIISSYLSRD